MRDAAGGNIYKGGSMTVEGESINKITITKELAAGILDSLNELIFEYDQRCGRDCENYDDEIAVATAQIEQLEQAIREAP
jgi:hypothetical protein